MAEPWEWEEADLQALITNQATEGTELDFKACDALGKTDGKKAELSKDVSALANAAGGTIVYGIIEERHVASSLDAGYDSTEISHEWISQVINSNIRPRINGVRVRPVSLTSNRSGRNAYVVLVPQGTTAHQAADKRYYRRQGTERVAMEDYEIRDVMQRALAARHGINVLVYGATDGRFEFRQSDDRWISPAVTGYAENEEGAGVAAYAQHQLFCASSKVGGLQGWSACETRAYFPAGELHFSLKQFPIAPNELPLFSGERRELLGFTFTLSPSATREDLVLPLMLWRTRTARSVPRAGAVLFRQVLGRDWQFWPVEIEGVSEHSIRVEFVP